MNYSTGEQQAQEVGAAIERLGGTGIAMQADASQVGDINRLFSSHVRTWATEIPLLFGSSRADSVTVPVRRRTMKLRSEVHWYETREAANEDEARLNLLERRNDVNLHERLQVEPLPKQPAGDI